MYRYFTETNNTSEFAMYWRADETSAQYFSDPENQWVDSAHENVYSLLENVDLGHNIEITEDQLPFRSK
jgi:hypothetical protein